MPINTIQDAKRELDKLAILVTNKEGRSFFDKLPRPSDDPYKGFDGNFTPKQ